MKISGIPEPKRHGRLAGFAVHQPPLVTTLLGGVIPYDRVWRTGANAATQLSITVPIRLAGVPLDSGAYTLWTLPTQRQVQLIINRETGQWGTGYQARNDIARVAMEVDTLEAPVEQFTIRIDTTSSRLILDWGTFRWSAPLEAVGRVGR